MSGHQHATIEDTVYFWFAANDTSGSGGDGATPLYDVREAGVAASAIPLLSGTPSLLSHANYPAGLHEIAVVATAANGFAADDTFAVFCTIAIDSQNPSGFVGSCTLTPLAKAAALAAVPTATEIVDEWESQSQADPTGFHVNLLEIGGQPQTANDNGEDINTILSRIVGTLATGTHNPATAAQIAVLSDWINGGRLDLLLDAIKVVTDGQAATGSGLSAIPWNANWDAELQSEVADALAVFWTSPANLVDLVWNEVISKAAHNVAQSAAKILRQGGDLAQIDGAVSDASPTTTDFDTDLTEIDGYFNDALMVFSNGAANAGIGKHISAYVNASGNMTFVAAMAWPVTPVNGDDFTLYAIHAHPIAEIQSGLATEAKQDIIDTIVDTMVLGIIIGAAATGTLSTTQATSDLTEYTDDQLIGRIITVTSGVADGESSAITDYAETNGLLTFDLMTLAMGNGDTFKIT